MSEPKLIAFSHKEVVEALLKKHDLHEGIWGLYIKFGLKAANMGTSPSDLQPAAILPVLEIGLQVFLEENNLSVDAAKVNPRNAQGVSLHKKSRPTRHKQSL